MTESLIEVPAEQFINFADNDINRWQLLVEQTMIHPKLGDGTIIEVVKQSDHVILVVTFTDDSRPRRFSGAMVVEVCGRLWLTQEVADQVLGVKTVDQEEPTLTPGPDGEQPSKDEQVERPEPLFKIGQEVMVRTDPSQRGAILIEPFWGVDEWQYELFFGAQDKRIFQESDLVTVHAAVEWVRLNELLRNLALIKLRNPLSNNLYALYASRTEFEVYQFRPAMKFLGNPDQRLLIADEVGLGKTIEAGIIYLELQARIDLSRVLVVCPSGLKVKWQDEMQLRFDEEFDILDSKGVDQFLKRYEQNGVNQRLRGITSLELLRRPEFADQFVEMGVHLDLVIIDEAHHCRNTTTRSNNLATVLSDSADAMLLLTATPLQLGNEDLFNLLRILSPGEFDNLFVFLERLEPNQFINRAGQILATGDHQAALSELKKVEETRERRRFTGNPYYAEVSRILGESYVKDSDLVHAQRRLVELNTLANIFTRTRKRELGDKVPTRSAFTLKVKFTDAEARFYDRVIRHVREEFAALHGSNYVVGFVSIMRERQVASCISAARQRFADLVKDSPISDDEQSYLDPEVVGEWDDEEQLKTPADRARWYRNAARQMNEGQVDSKFETFISALRLVLDEDDESKIIVFSFFRATIEYLYNQLSRLRIGVQYIHGGIKVVDRPAVIDKFRLDPECRVLISSEVGAEGLDFQFCNTIFNYDLPWNPMRVEQRIGRIDRFGQKSPKIRIYNMVIANSIEERILMRLYDRIGLFRRAIGDIEAILGEEIRELSKKVYTSRLSPSEESTLAERAAQNIIRRQQEMEEFEEKQLQFMGQEAIFSTLVNQTIESGSYLSDVEVRGLVQTFIQDGFKRSHLDLNRTGGATYALDLDHELAAHIRNFVRNNRHVDRTAKDFIRNLEPGKILPITFASEVAQERKLLNFITARHPLTQAAASYWRDEQHIDPVNDLAYFGIKSDSLRPGDYYFFLFLLESSGAEQSTRLVPVSVVAENSDVYTALSQQLLHMIQTRAYDCGGALPKLERAELVEAERMAKIYMTARRDEIKGEIDRSNKALVNARLTAVTQSYEAKKRRVEKLLREATNEKIITMHTGQLRNIEADYNMKTSDIEKQRSVSVSFSLALRGYVTVEGS